MALNDELHKVSTWLDANKLSINAKKTHVMGFHRSRIKTSDINVVMHILHVKHKIARSVGILYKIRHKETLLNMYYTFVFPYLIYGVEIWGSAPLNHINSQKKFFFKCVCTITFSEYLAPSEPIYQILNVLNSENLVIQRISLLMFKCSHGDVPVSVSQLFRTNNEYHNYNTRNCVVFMHQLAQLKQVIELSATEGYTFGITFHKKINTNTSYACLKNLVKIFNQNNNLTHMDGRTDGRTYRRRVRQQ